jgi:hypothetical protein
MEIITTKSCYTGYNYNDHFSTGSFSASQIPLTELHYADVSFRGFTDED